MYRGQKIEDEFQVGKNNASDEQERCIPINRKKWNLFQIVSLSYLFFLWEVALCSDSLNKTGFPSSYAKDCPVIVTAS